LGGGVHGKPDALKLVLQRWIAGLAFAQPPQLAADGRPRAHAEEGADVPLVQAGVPAQHERRHGTRHTVVLPATECGRLACGVSQRMWTWFTMQQNR